jgi:hypothetical protein
MPDVPPELSSFLDEANAFAAKYETLLQVLIFPLIAAVVGGVKIFRDRQRNRPDLHLELVDVRPAGGEEHVTFGLRVVNLGEQPATRTRYTWTPRSSLLMTPVPAGFLVVKGEPRRFEFTMDTDEFMGRGLAGAMRPHYRLLGWLEVTYYAGWGLWRTVCTAIYVGNEPALPIMLGKVPRPPWRDYITPLKKWHDKQIRDKDIQNLDQYLQRSREYLAERGIEVSLLFPRESLNRLFGELQRRGWQFSYGPGGRGEEVYAKKERQEYPGATIRLSARTMVDAATLVLKSAIESDEEYGT